MLQWLLNLAIEVKKNKFVNLIVWYNNKTWSSLYLLAFFSHSLNNINLNWTAICQCNTFIYVGISQCERYTYIIQTQPESFRPQNVLGKPYSKTMIWIVEWFLANIEGKMRYNNTTEKCSRFVRIHTLYTHTFECI